MRASQGADVRIEAPDQDAHYVICCLRDLNAKEFNVSWQHRHYDREREPLNPKFETAEKMIDTVKSSPVLRGYLFLEEEDDIRVELLLGEYGEKCDYCGHCPY